MDFFDLLTLFGGLAMFLYGMRLMGAALKESSSGALKTVLESVTNNPLKAFVLGVVVTAIIQSSTATIVITSGLVSAGILSLHQSLGIIIGANVGTTVTGQIIRLLDLNAGGNSLLRLFQPSSLAPLTLIVGIVLIMGFHFKFSDSIGNICIGFGILFSGLLNMTSAVSVLSDSGVFEKLLSNLGANPVIGYMTGAGVAFVLQSSSATIGILQAFSQSGALTFKAIYAVIAGVYLGDCVTTAIVCSIGANAESRRVGIVNILYNLSKTFVVLSVVTILHYAGFLDALWERTADASVIANTNTIFNLSCAILLLPFIRLFERGSYLIVKEVPVSENKYKEVIDGLNPVFFATPAIALRSCYTALMTMFEASRDNIETALTLLSGYDDKVKAQVLEEEENINLLTDRVSRYLVELLPQIREEYQVHILNQYYRSVSEFENLGDIAKDIAAIAEEKAGKKITFSPAATDELQKLVSMSKDVIHYAEDAFRNRDVAAAGHIEPLSLASDALAHRMHKHHLNRMSQGECDVVTGASFMNTVECIKKIFDICSNIGMSTLVRVQPELTNQEHRYISRLRSGGDDSFNKEYNELLEKWHIA